jgi:glycosyltransferase involved in cell wall biosynthesis
MAQYLPIAARMGIATVFDAHNAVWQLVRDLADREPVPPKRAAAAIEWRLLRRFEGRAARDSALTMTVSETDCAALEEAAGVPIRARIAPIGVEARSRPWSLPRTDACRLLSVATMHYPPNAEALRWFRDDIWPLIREQSPDAMVDVVGQRPPVDLLAWGDSDERVQVHGFVPEITPLYRNAAVFLVPLKSGSGVRVKVLEAMAEGVPIVTTSIGIEGLELTPDRHVLVADTPGEFAAAVVRLLRTPELRIALATEARQHVVDHYDWRVCCRPVLDGYALLPRRSTRVQRVYA